MQGVDWKPVVELASAGELLREESLDRASRSLHTWRPDVEALPAVSQDLGLSEASVRLLVDLWLRLPPDAPREEVRRALAAALPADPTQAADVGTSPTLPGDASPAR